MSCETAATAVAHGDGRSLGGYPSNEMWHRRIGVPTHFNLCHSPLVSDLEISDELICQVPGRAAAASKRVQVHAESVKVPVLFSDSSCYDVAALTPAARGNPRALAKGDARAPHVRKDPIDFKSLDVRSGATSAWAPRAPSRPCVLAKT
jgi:hypothetical protein